MSFPKMFLRFYTDSVITEESVFFKLFLQIASCLHCNHHVLDQLHSVHSLCNYQISPSHICGHIDCWRTVAVGNIFCKEESGETFLKVQGPPQETPNTQVRCWTCSTTASVSCEFLSSSENEKNKIQSI